MVAETGPSQYSSNNITAPAYDGFAITPSDTINEDAMFRAIYTGVGGNIEVVTSIGTVLLFVGVLQGSILPIQGVRINNTNTTASSLIGFI